MIKAFIFFVTLFGLTACVDILEENKSKNTEQQRFKELLTDGVWNQYRNINSIPDTTSIPNNLNYATSIQSHTLSFNMNGTFTSTSDVISTAHTEPPYDIDPITSIGRYTLRESITTQSGLKAMSIDLDWQIDDNNTDITLDIVYIGKTSLYLGLPRKLPSCEGIEEPFYETYDIAATDESFTSGGGLDVSLISDLDEGFIGHIREGCYGRPNTLDFDHPYTRIYIDTSSHSLVPLPTESAGLESDVLILDPIGIAPHPVS